jgi:MAF protein
VSEPSGSSPHVDLILASASPRRRELLTALKLPFRVVVADVDEQVLPREAPDALTMRLSQTKALTIAGRVALEAGALSTPADWASEPIVLAADTVVALDGEILNKPDGAAEAAAMLASLRGRTHQVYTGIALAVGVGIAWCSVVRTQVTMRAYSDDELATYIASGSPFDKAGGYGIQDGDFRPVARIEGCYANVVGLPLCEVRRALAAAMPARAWGPAAGCDCASIDTRWYGDGVEG